MPQPPKDTTADVLTEIRSLCRRFATSDGRDDPQSRPRLEVAAGCLWVAYGLTCRVAYGSHDGTARLERAQLQLQGLPAHEQFQELSEQISSEFAGLTSQLQDDTDARLLLDASADSLRAAMGFLASVLGDVSPRLGVDLGSEYLRRADAAYHEVPHGPGPAGADPIHVHLKNAGAVSEGLVAAPR
ncbi:hypothetical protein [Streptomyces sp. 900105245]